MTHWNNEGQHVAVSASDDRTVILRGSRFDAPDSHHRRVEGREEREDRVDRKVRGDMTGRGDREEREGRGERGDRAQPVGGDRGLQDTTVDDVRAPHSRMMADFKEKEERLHSLLEISKEEQVRGREEREKMHSSVMQLEELLKNEKDKVRKNPNNSDFLVSFSGR